MDFDEEDFSNWNPNISLSIIFGFSDFREKLFYVDFILTQNSGSKILHVIPTYPESAKEWIKTNAVLLLSDGYTKLRFDPYTFRLFLDKDGSQLCSMNFYKIARIRNSIREDLRIAKYSI